VIHYVLLSPEAENPIYKLRGTAQNPPVYLYAAAGGFATWQACGFGVPSP
jgi:hypothetical protein